jgi:release factor glutamine methyltransferase
VFAEAEAALLVDAAASEHELVEFVARRVAGEPLQVIVGWAEFCDLRIEVDRGVFVPRPRTELLAECAIERVGPGAIVVDMCCGSGAVGTAVLAACDGVTVFASDIDPTAVRCARRNIEPRGGVVVQGDLYDALPPDVRGRIGVLAVNAPYVPTGAIETMPSEARLHEPRTALDGGVDGLDFHRRVAEGAPEWLAAGGVLLIETSASQAADTASLLSHCGLSVSVQRSAELDGTVVIGRNNAVSADL